MKTKFRIEEIKRDSERRVKQRKFVHDVIRIVSNLDGKEDYAANLAHFLQSLGKGINGRWRGNIYAKDQRALFGRFIGKGTITIDGEKEIVYHTKKVCFGHDFDVTVELNWKEL